MIRSRSASPVEPLIALPRDLFAANATPAKIDEPLCRMRVAVADDRQIASGDCPVDRGIRSGNQGVRPVWARLLPDMLRPLGFRSYHSGKWHIDGRPLENGFDHSYWQQDAGRNFNPRERSEDDRPLPAVEPGTGYYSTTVMADYAIKFLKDHAEHHGDYDYTAADRIIPHPVYAVQSWISVVNPGPATADQLRDLLTLAHARAARRQR